MFTQLATFASDHRSAETHERMITQLITDHFSEGEDSGAVETYSGATEGLLDWLKKKFKGRPTIKDMLEPDGLDKYTNREVLREVTDKSYDMYPLAYLDNLRKGMEAVPGVFRTLLTPGSLITTEAGRDAFLKKIDTELRKLTEFAITVEMGESSARVGSKFNADENLTASKNPKSEGYKDETLLRLIKDYEKTYGTIKGPMFDYTKNGQAYLDKMSATLNSKRDDLTRNQLDIAMFCIVITTTVCNVVFRSTAYAADTYKSGIHRAAKFYEKAPAKDA